MRSKSHKSLAGESWLSAHILHGHGGGREMVNALLISTHGPNLYIIYLDEVCEVFVFVLQQAVSPLRELTKPRAPPKSAALPFCTLPSNVFALASCVFLQATLPRASITLAPKEKYCTLKAMTKWNMFEANHVFPCARDYVICSRNMFRIFQLLLLQCL